MWIWIANKGDLTEVKIFQKVLGGATFFKHPVVYLVVFIVQYVTAHQTCRKKVCTYSK